MTKFFMSILLVVWTIQIKAQVPAKPSQPIGKSSLCNINADTRYTTRSVLNATSYIWSLIPSEAGSLRAQDTSVYIDFSEEYSGIAKLSVTATNSFGSSNSSDTLFISIIGLPNTPIMPIGDSLLCIGATTANFYINSQENAETYQWSISPVNSSYISASDTTAILHIYTDYDGDITINVTASNTCGSSNSSPIKVLRMIDIPFAPPIPSGEDYYCLNDSVHSFFTGGSYNATYYNWTLEPLDAGILTNHNDSLKIKWKKDFRKEFEVFVQAGNICGISEKSSPLKAYLNIIPPKPGKIIGDTVICEGKDYSVYTVGESDEATRYQWYISPDTAATMEGISKSGNAYWNSANQGFSSIYVSASNICGISPLSDSLKVLYIRKPEKMPQPAGVSEMCINAINTDYESAEVQNANYYQWIMVPANAGLVLSDNYFTTVNWTDDYMGTVRLAVRAVNSCGNGPSSDSLIISLKESLYADFSYTTDANVVNFQNKSFPELMLNSYSWSFGDGMFSIEKNPNHQYTSNGTYEVSLTVSNPFCQNNTTKTNIPISANNIFQHQEQYYNEFNLYPNPTNKLLYLNILDKNIMVESIEIINQSGKITQIHQANFVNNEQNIDISNLKTGIYIINIRSKEKQYRRKFIKLD